MPSKAGYNQIIMFEPDLEQSNSASIHAASWTEEAKNKEQLDLFTYGLFHIQFMKKVVFYLIVGHQLLTK